MIERPGRGAWLAGTGAVFGALSLGRRLAGAQSEAAVRIAGASTEGLCEAYYAEELGLFKRHGLNADVRVLPTAAPIAPAVASGDLHIGAGNALQVGTAHAHNIPFVIVATAEVHDKRFQNSAVVVAKQSPITSPRDLGGKSVAVSTLNGLEALAAIALIDQAGGDVSTVKFVEMGPLLVTDAIVTGRVDAGVLPEPMLSAAKDRTRAIGSGDDAIGAHTVQTVWYALRPWLDANKDAARRFAAAIYAAGDWATANPEKAAVILHKYISINEPRAYGRFSTKQDVAGMQAVFDAGAKYKFLPQVYAADFVWDGT
jgi:ABC-type nitrate/sulfonate/bicarbonate transport system substrate-binding protein